MILIFGGYYQGKLSFAKSNFSFATTDCYNCTTDINFSYPVLYNLDQYFLHLVEANLSPTDFIEANLIKLQDKIIILTDISCGVVPTSAPLRQWREEVGRCMLLLSKEATEVYRIYCGLPTRLK